MEAAFVAIDAGIFCSAAVEDDDGNFFYGGKPALLCNFLGIIFQSLVGPAGCCSPRHRVPVI